MLLLLGVGNFDDLNFVDLLLVGQELLLGVFRHDDDFRLFFLLLDDVLELVFFLNHFLLYVFRFYPPGNVIGREGKSVFIENAFETCVARRVISILLIKSEKVLETSHVGVVNHSPFAFWCRKLCCVLITMINDARDEFRAQFVDRRVFPPLIVTIEKICVLVFMFKGLDKRPVADGERFEEKRLANSFVQKEETFRVGSVFSLFCWLLKRWPSSFHICALHIHENEVLLSPVIAQPPKS